MTADEVRDRGLLAAEIRRRLGPPPEPPFRPPRVSIVVVNRNGADHLRRLFEGLRERTDYPDLELVLVDNGSSDDSLELARSAPAPFPISIIANPHNETFSDANNQGAGVASGELLLFLNNDTEPFEAGWLRELVAWALGSGAGIVGTTLIYRDAELGHPYGYALQHRGMRFLDEDGLLRADLHAYREDPLGEGFGEDAETPVVTAACMLVERALFEQVGGFTRGYRYGVEDTDLGLKVRAAGRRVVTSGRAFVIHHPGSTRRQGDTETRRARQRRNRRLLWESWGPRIRREYDLDLLSGRGLWADLGREPPPHLPTREQVTSLGFCVKAAARAQESGASGDELVLAEAASTVLGRRGHRFLLLGGGDVEDPRGLNYDIAVHVRGASRYIPKPAQLNVLWAVSHLDELTGIECSRYDLVATASGDLATRLRAAGCETPMAVLDVDGASPAGLAEALVDAVAAAAGEHGLPAGVDSNVPAS